jgi:hypothetical protein
MTMTSLSADTPITVTAACPAGKVILGGGGRASTNDSVFLRESYPLTTTPNGWSVAYMATSNVTDAITVTAIAICSK